MPDFNREIPVQLFLGRQTEIMFDDRGVIECFRKGELSEIYYMTSNLHLKADGEGITIHDENGEITSGLSGIRCKPRGSSSYVNFDGKSYRGYFKVAYDSLSSYLILYNLVDLEDYLKGVLPAEIGERSKDEYEAAKAQAVAARTYAVWRLISDGEAGKLYPTVADQVYIGKDAELDLLSRAIKDTEGEILMYKGGPVAAYYHAVCGGATIPIEKAWPHKERLPYLEGADDRDYCTWAKTYYWMEEFDIETLAGNLASYFSVLSGTLPNAFDEIYNVDFQTDENINRANKMDVFAGPNVFTVEADQIRWALGRPSKPGAILPSTKFKVKKIENSEGLQKLIITGVGNGHGAGACQCGFIGRARSGQKYDEMLNKYYKGVKLVKIY
jgi:stage II sporulation protein D